MVPKLQEELRQTKPFASREEEVYLNIQHTAEALWWGVSETLKRAELTPTQYNVLRILRGAGEAGASCGEISERLVTKDSDITRLLDRLERQGLVRRARDVADRRVVLAYIEPAGERALASVDAPLAAAHRQRFRPLGRAGTDALQESLEALLGG